LKHVGFTYAYFKYVCIYFTDLESFELWYWRRMEVRCTDRVRNEEVLQRVEEERNMLQTVQRRKANWIGHVLLMTAF